MSNQSFSAMPSWSALRLSEFLAKLTNLTFFRGRLSYASSHSAYDRSSPAQPSGRKLTVWPVQGRRCG
eukprot:scaffold57858_cov36-Phaeocystis_antarctica.AAC.1